MTSGTIARAAVAVAILLGPTGGAAQSRSGGSEVPCAAPLAWRLARVDEGFGITEAEATRALLEAGRMWEAAAGRPLFRHDPQDGFPIRLVYDERQVRADERAGEERVLASERSRLDEEGRALTARGDRHAAARARLTERGDDLVRRIAAHNALVQSWNQRGGASEALMAELDSAGRALDEERAGIEGDRRTMDEDFRAIRRDVAGLNRALEELTAREEALARRFPPEAVEAGEYREAVRWEGGRVASIGREIRIYRFRGAEELRVIAAHEFGHALGVGHSEDPRAVMSAARDASVEEVPPRELHAADLALLRATCPRWVGGAPARP